jgi:hypothetical protein
VVLHFCIAKQVQTELRIACADRGGEGVFLRLLQRPELFSGYYEARGVYSGTYEAMQCSVAGMQGSYAASMTKNLRCRVGGTKGEQTFFGDYVMRLVTLDAGYQLISRFAVCRNCATVTGRQSYMNSSTVATCSSYWRIFIGVCETNGLG